MNLRKTVSNDVYEVSLSGKFTFTDHQNFRTLVTALSSGVITTMIIDLSNLEFVDSAALGMFLVAKEEAKKNNVALILQNPVGHVQKMFELSNFKSLFEIR